MCMLSEKSSLCLDSPPHCADLQVNYFEALHHIIMKIFEKFEVVINRHRNLF